MSTFKKTKVVMLPTNEKSKLVLSFKEKSFNQLIEPKLILLLEEANYQFSNIESEHLYFLSDEEIKEGDWVYDGTEIWQVKSYYGFQPITKKIIATTDSNLTIKTLLFVQGENKEIDVLLPQPSQSFIEKFVEEYNKGNVITEVMVEYETITKRYGSCSIGESVTMNVEQLKVSKDNTITIRKAKDSWSREEVKVILEKAIYEREQFLNKSGTLSYNFDKWIEENL